MNGGLKTLQFHRGHAFRFFQDIFEFWVRAALPGDDATCKSTLFWYRFYIWIPTLILVWIFYHNYLLIPLSGFEVVGLGILFLTFYHSLNLIFRWEKTIAKPYSKFRIAFLKFAKSLDVVSKANIVLLFIQVCTYSLISCCVSQKRKIMVIFYSENMTRKVHILKWEKSNM